MHKRLYHFILAGACILYFIHACNPSASNPGTESGQIPEQISYNFDIRPILSDKCFACHGPDANKREAELRLDIAENAYKALKENPSAHALVPGKPEFSEVFQRISSDDTTVMMPPPSSNLKLTSHEINLIEEWIKQGAKYEPHWAFVLPTDPGKPEVENTEWPKNEIDHFILSK